MYTFLGLDNHVHHVLQTDFGPKPTPPISPAIANVISFTVQYLAVYFLLHAVKSYSQLQLAGRRTSYDRLLDQLARTVQFCPMLAILYIGIRLRAVTMDPLGAPPLYLQHWMNICAVAVIVDLVLVIFIHFSIGNESNAGMASWVLTMLKFGILGILYAGLAFMIIGFLGMQAPEGGVTPSEPVPGQIPVIVPPTTTSTTTVPPIPPVGEETNELPEGVTDSSELEEEDTTPPLPPALMCLISLTIQYFAIYFCLNVVMMWNKLMRGGFKTPLEKILDEVKETCKFCPILAVLFIGARMRALELDPEGAPQKWAQNLMEIATNCVLAQTVLQLFLPFFTGKWNAKLDTDGNVASRSSKTGTVGFLISFARYVMLIGLYISIIGVCWSVMTIRAPKGKTSFPVSPAMVNVMILVCLFVIMYFLLSAVKTYTEIFMDVNVQSTVVERVLTASLPALEYIPMVCVLFVGCRMRALQVHPSGRPQKWAQDMMCFTSYGIIALTVVSLIIPFFTYELEDDEEIPLVAEEIKNDIGNKTQPPPKPQRPLSGNAKMFTFIKFIFLGGTYICVGGIISSMFSISANAYQ